MHLARGTTAGQTAAPAPFGSATTLSASTHHSEGTTSMALTTTSPSTRATVRTQAGGGRLPA